MRGSEIYSQKTPICISPTSPLSIPKSGTIFRPESPIKIRARNSRYNPKKGSNHFAFSNTLSHSAIAFAALPLYSLSVLKCPCWTRSATFGAEYR
jgi:hypothetical protein